MINLAISIVIAYLIGSIPTAYIFGKLIKGIDIRNYGSGNVGATNLFRVVGKVPGVISLFIDMLKGYLPVVILPIFFSINSNSLTPDSYKLLLGASAIMGHVWPVFLKFKGGKGVATTAGVVLAIMPIVFLISFAMWIFVFLALRYVSLASIFAALTMPIAVMLLKRPFSTIVFAVILCIIGIYKHKTNISRLLKGEEKRLF
ncbi:MAG: glycerol-3-phosphate 1-O-acyltransferase PlsY [Candidatus Omnitrophica bacterium]|nr:glycerol-3-phosphate 1-O-acyltransferase PlsY [Candidatus Omnitrophota bacterium]